MCTVHSHLPEQDAQGPRPDSAGWRREVLHSRPEIARSLETLDRCLADRGYGEEDRFAVHVATEEALTNAVLHGHDDDPSKQVVLRYRLDAERVLVSVEDEGGGFDPRQVADPLAADNLDRPGGRGLLLMRSLTSWLRFNERGNRVAFCRRRASERPGKAEGRR